jgi:flagellar hook-associated protein 2
MVDVAKPDYLSLVNKNGSGFNVSELVEAMVSAEIEPRRTLENDKLKKTETAISGISYLNSQVTKTMNNFTTISSDKFFSAVSSNSSGVGLTITDESKSAEGTVSIANVSTAKKMVFEFAGFNSLAGSFSADLTINFGSWSESSGTYTFSGSGTSVNLDQFSGKTLQEVADILDAVDGISAQIIDKTGTNNNYSLTITGSSTGASAGFQIVDSLAGKDGRWETPANPSVDAYDNNFNQLASDASFDFNGVTLSRTTNSISDLIAGSTLELKSDFSSAATITMARSKSAILQTINDTIFSLNEFKAEIDKLTEIVVGGDNGPLAMDPAVSKLKSDFKKLSVAPISGYADSDIYLTELGIKTNANGQFYLDETVFNKTYTNNPERFSVLKDQNLTTNKSSVVATRSIYTSIPPGKYAVSDSSGSWKLGDTVSLTREDLSDGGSSFSTSSYPGLLMISTVQDPGDFTLYAGTSFSKKIIDLMNDVLDESSSISNANTTYTAKNDDLSEKLEQLEQREKLLKTRYTAQFGDMESAMTQFNGTKTLLENLVDSWNQK